MLFGLLGGLGGMFDAVKIRVVLALLMLPATGWADASRPGGGEPVADEIDGWAFKLTPSYYATTNQHSATDVNLRANFGQHALWLGVFRRGGEFEQTRSGYELTLSSDYARLIPSLQVATHGFAGAAVNLEVGRSIYALLGYGRTNAREYYNLNFDPNDSLVLGLGTRLISQTNLSVFNVKDNRLHTEQSVTHAVFRYQPDDRQRLTLDLFEKHGRATPDDPKVSGHGVAFTYDYRDVFVRVARDRKVNFSADDQTRVSVGLRF